MSIFGPAHSAQTEEKSKATRWNANSFQILQKCNSFLQPTLKYHHNISVVDLVEGPGWPAPPNLGKNQDPPPLSSRSGSTTVYLFHEKVARIIFEIIFLTDLLQ